MRRSDQRISQSVAGSQGEADNAEDGLERLSRLGEAGAGSASGRGTVESARARLRHLGGGKEAGWIQARAAAEGVKSECFRYAAKAGPYSGPDAEAAKAFQARIDALSKLAFDKSLTPADDPVPASGDKREPIVPLTKDWYKTGRMDEQVEYYRKARSKNEAMADRLWWVAFLSGLAAVAFGALGVRAQAFAPWIGAMTTIAAFGLIDRRKYLISTYAAMQSSLERIKALDEASPANLADLVTATENLLESEHKAWLPQMLAVQRQPAAQPEQPQQPQPQQQQGSRLISTCLKALCHSRESGSPNSHKSNSRCFSWSCAVGGFPFSAKRGRWPKAGWVRKAGPVRREVRGDARAIRLGFGAAGHTPSGASRHPPRPSPGAGEGEPSDLRCVNAVVRESGYPNSPPGVRPLWIPLFAGMTLPLYMVSTHSLVYGQYSFTLIGADNSSRADPRSRNI